jgi:hypothetical protein
MLEDLTSTETKLATVKNSSYTNLFLKSYCHVEDNGLVTGVTQSQKREDNLQRLFHYSQ